MFSPDLVLSKWKEESSRLRISVIAGSEIKYAFDGTLRESTQDALVFSVDNCPPAVTVKTGIAKSELFEYSDPREATTEDGREKLKRLAAGAISVKLAAPDTFVLFIVECGGIG